MNFSSGTPDFDTLAALYQRDACAFEALRKRLLRQAVDAAPAARRPALEKTLCRIDQAREAAETPMEAVLIAARMMHESMRELQSGWDRALQALAGLQASLVIHQIRNAGPDTPH